MIHMCLVEEQKVLFCVLFFFLKNHPRTYNFIHFWWWKMAIAAKSTVFPSKQLRKKPNVLCVKKKIMYLYFLSASMWAHARTHTHDILLSTYQLKRWSKTALWRHKGPSEERMDLTVFDVDVFVGKWRRSYFATHF